MSKLQWMSGRVSGVDSIDPKDNTEFREGLAGLAAADQGLVPDVSEEIRSALGGHEVDDETVHSLRDIFNEAFDLHRLVGTRYKTEEITKLIADKGIDAIQGKTKKELQAALAGIRKELEDERNRRVHGSTV